MDCEFRVGVEHELRCRGRRSFPRAFPRQLQGGEPFLSATLFNVDVAAWSCDRNSKFVFAAFVKAIEQNAFKKRENEHRLCSRRLQAGF